MPGKSPGPSIKNPSVYEALRKKGYSKEKAARISNAMGDRLVRDRELPLEVKMMPAAARSIWRAAFRSSIKEEPERLAGQIALRAVQQKFSRVENEEGEETWVEKAEAEKAAEAAKAELELPELSEQVEELAAGANELESGEGVDENGNPIEPPRDPKNPGEDEDEDEPEPDDDPDDDDDEPSYTKTVKTSETTETRGGRRKKEGEGEGAGDSIQFDETYTLDADTAKRFGMRLRRDGYLVAEPRVARTGIQLYRGWELGRPDMKVVRVMRPESEVFDKPGAMASLAHIPITLDHPDVPVNSENWKKLAVGQTTGDVARDGDFVRVPLMIADKAAIDAAQSGTSQLSVGYSARLLWGDGENGAGEKFDAMQTQIRANHIALVSAARGGEKLKLGDHTDREFSQKEREKLAAKGHALPGGCLTGDTMIITRDGLIQIQSLTGYSIEVLSIDDDGNAKWQHANILEFQPSTVIPIIFSCGQELMTVRATSEHRWILSDGSEVHSTQLMPGDTVPCIIPPEFSTWWSDHGRAKNVQGMDGGISVGKILCSEGTWGEDAISVEMQGLLQEGREREVSSASSQSSDRPSGWGMASTGREDFDLCAMQANASSDGISLEQDAWALARNVPVLLQYRSSSLSKAQIGERFGLSHQGKNYTKKRRIAPKIWDFRRAVYGFMEATKRKMRFVRSLFGIKREAIGCRSLPRVRSDSWSVVRFLQYKIGVAGKQRRDQSSEISLRWSVVAVGHEQAEERVFCAVVPETGCFVLAGGILTGNSYPIKNESDLRNAIQAVGRAKNRSQVISHIKKRARALGLTKHIPEGWGDSALEEERNMITRNIDGVSIELEDIDDKILGRHLTALNNKIADQGVDVEKIKAQIAALQAQLAAAMKAGDAKDGEIVELKKQVEDAKLTPDKRDKEIKDFMAVVDRAMTFFGDAKYTWEGKSVEQIRRDVVAARHGDQKAKAMNDGMIEGAFLSLTETEQQDGFSRMTQSFSRPPSPSFNDKAASAYDKRNVDLATRWQRNKTKTA